MHRLIIGMCVLGLAVVAVRAEDDPAKMPKPKAVWTELLAKYRTAKPAERTALFTTYGNKFLAYAEKNPKSPEAAEAIGFLMQLPIPDSKDSPKTKALPLLKGMMENKDLAKAARVQAFNHYMNAQEEIVSSSTEANKVADARTAIDEGRKLIKGDLKGLVKDLFVGATMPELKSKGLDDKEVKLSDLKGKVVVLDIWATWCPPCRAMIPHEREMVNKLKGKPFVLVSISSDDKKETLTEFLKSNDMPWAHWWEGRGPLLRQLDIRFFPTIFVLDGKGVIRYKGVRGEAMDKAVETLLKEMEDKTKTGT